MNKKVLYAMIAIKIALLCSMTIIFYFSNYVWAEELLVRAHWLTTLWDGREVLTGGNQLFKVNTETGERTSENRLPNDNCIQVASALNGTLYGMGGDKTVLEEASPIGYNRTIYKYVPSISASGDIFYSHHGREVVFERFCSLERDDDIVKLMSSIAVQQVPGRFHQHRLYFSVACGPCDKNAIYYVDDIGNPVMYYNVETLIPSCEGLHPYWSGNFSFGDDGTLYLSSGNHVPASIYRVVDPRLDPLPEGTVAEVLWTTYDSGIYDFQVIGSNIYFNDGFRILRVDMETLGDADEVFNDPELFLLDVDKWTREAAGVSLRLPSYEMEVSEIREPPDPDLEIDHIEIGIQYIKMKGTSLTIPVRVFIRNSGNAVDSEFNVGFKASYEGISKPINVPFIVIGQKSTEPPIMHRIQSNSKIAIGGVVHVEGFKNKLPYGKEITLTAQVDKCENHKKESIHCSVKEKNENNNEKSINFTLVK